MPTKKAFRFIQQTEDTIRCQTLETGILFDENGNVLWQKQGGKESIEGRE